VIATALVLLLCQEPVQVEGQPLAANVERLVQAMELLGHPLPDGVRRALKAAGPDGRKIQEALDPVTFLIMTPGLGTLRGAGPGAIQQAGYTPLVLKIVNPQAATTPLRVKSPQAGPVYAGVAELSMKRQDQRRLREDENVKGDSDRFLDLEIFGSPPMAPALSGLSAEYAILLVYSSASGRHSAEIGVDGAAGKVEFDVRPAIPVRLAIRDADGTPTTGRFVFVDAAGRVHPPQPKRLAPDLFFQKQIYRHDGESVLLPPGRLAMRYGRGPEYRDLEREVIVPEEGGAAIEVRLERWVDPMARGFWGGDHHIHAAGCAHYSKPTEGVLAADMFRQVKGEALNVGCVLTWGPCFDFQQQFFSPGVHPLSEPRTLLKYDIEVSGFGSQALGHVCLLNLREQIYPGAEGSKGWPSWTTPVLRWAKEQGGVTGYAHSASGLQVSPENAARRLMDELDLDRDGRVSREEAARGLLPEDFDAIDADRDGLLTLPELVRSVDRSADTLPNLAVPEMNSVGAMEIFVTAPLGLCDFISAMDTARLPEWNAWYHLMNCGLPVKVSGETDFPCMSGTRVGQGRVYVKLGKVGRLDYATWCRGMARGQSYVSDGYAHALAFLVQGKESGDEVTLAAAGAVGVKATVAFSPQTPLETPYGSVAPREGRRMVGDTVDLHPGPAVADKGRRIELIVNGRVAAWKEVPADGREHELSWTIEVERSSWVALRHFPQLHTNPVNVIIGGKPIRVSRKDALWCIGCIEQLWRVRANNIHPSEREEAKRTFDAGIEYYRRVATESSD
jgi:hypothetical protein